jgi:hypothetical protein
MGPGVLAPRLDVQRSLLAGFLSLPRSFSASLDFSPLLSQNQSIARQNCSRIVCPRRFQAPRFDESFLLIVFSAKMM